MVAHGGDLNLPPRRQVLAVEVHHPRGGPVQAAEELEQRGLAVAGRALDGEPLPVLDPQIHAGQRVNRGPPLLVVLGDAGQFVHGCSPHSTRASASAGRSRAARQPPNPPAIKPPAMASTTASATAANVTCALRWTVTALAASAASRRNPPMPPPPPPPKPPPPNPPPGGPPPANERAPPGVAEPVARPAVAVSGGASRDTSAAPAKPSTMPPSPPMMPMVIDSPSTWPTIRLLRQPSALSVPNSRTRRDTADIVSRLASRKAAARTATASHLPRLRARLEALASDPVTSLARSLEVVTLAVGATRVNSLDTVLIMVALLAAT